MFAISLKRAKAVLKLKKLEGCDFSGEKFKKIFELYLKWENQSSFNRRCQTLREITSSTIYYPIEEKSKNLQLRNAIEVEIINKRWAFGLKMLILNNIYGLCVLGYYRKLLKADLPERSHYHDPYYYLDYFFTEL
ncbi:hypothetical protein Glove_440g6 [Diversispora epigaea]|uniref:Uncharacterized protein n=1 Tax=Diversispora epigaea TaxID=1348612 RepID=A0A397GX37_9GLOM|nr:hypothetical protein Glove_440g6 [Diversispora epigaea]